MAICGYPVLEVEGLVADGFAGKVVQETHHILLGENSGFRVRNARHA
jgi:hypothetical protein